MAEDPATQYRERWTTGELAVLMAERDRLMGERDRRIDAEMKAIREATITALSSSERAKDKADVSVDERLKSMNEFRAALADKDRLLMPRAEAQAEISRLSEKIEALGSRMDRWEGKSAGGAALWGYIVGAAGFAAAISAILARFL